MGGDRREREQRGEAGEAVQAVGEAAYGEHGEKERGDREVEEPLAAGEVEVGDACVEDEEGDRRGDEGEAKARDGGDLAGEVFAQPAEEGGDAAEGEGDRGAAGFGFEGEAAGGYAGGEGEAADARGGNGVDLAAENRNLVERAALVEAARENNERAGDHGSDERKYGGFHWGCQRNRRTEGRF